MGYLNVRGVPHYIRSASFLIRDGSYTTLDQLPNADTLRTDKRPLQQLAPVLDPAFKSGVAVTRSNVSCLFANGAQLPRPLMDTVADIYERMLSSSLNFGNAIDAVNYAYSKPDTDLEFHPRFTSPIEVGAAIHERFGLDSEYFIFTGTRKGYRGNARDFRKHDASRIDEVLPFYSSGIFQHRLAGCIKFKQPFIGTMLLASPLPVHFCIFPAYDPSIRGSSVEGIVVLWSDRAIPVSAFRAAGTWLREVWARRHMEKARFLAELRSRAEHELVAVARYSAPGRRARQDAITRLSEFMCARIRDLTNAESATVRLRHDTASVLRLYGLAHTQLGEYKDGLAIQRPHLDIHLHEWRESAVAFAFYYPGADTEIYINDIDNIPPKYTTHGLERILRVRENTQCEAVLRVRRGGLLAAAINVESPIEGALKVELPFLQDCSNVLSDFLTRLETIGDSSGLASIAEAQIQIHAIKGDLLNWKPEQADRAVQLLTRLKRNLEPASLGNVPAPHSVRLFNSSLHERVRTYLARTGSEYSVDDIVTGEVPDDFPVASLASLEVIFDSLWTNMIKNSQMQENRLSFEPRDQAFGLKRVLAIQWHAPSRLPESLDRDQLLLQPVTDNEGAHYGFFLIGVHTRLLGGHAELEELSHGFALRVFVPYDPQSFERDTA